MDNKYLELAKGLKNSNVNEVKQLAEAFIELSMEYDVCYQRLFKTSAELVMIKHANIFKKLAESGD